MTKKKALEELKYIENYLSCALKLCNDSEESYFSSYIDDLREYIKDLDVDDDERR